MMDLDIQTVEILLLVGALVAIGARRLHLPYTVGLVLAGAVLAFIPVTDRAPLTKELIFNLFLPPLVFEAAFLIRWDALRRDLGAIALLATFGLLLSVAVIVAGLIYLLGWDWRAALLFGTLISATDPVSVIATFKELGTHGRLRLLVEGESLLNDGTAAALFAVALAAGTSGAITVGGVFSSFALMSVGGILVGVVVGLFCVFLMGRTDDHLVEIALSSVAAFGSFLMAEHFHLSGVLATLCAGLLIGNFGPLKGLTAKGRDDAETFWEYAAFVANTLVFLLMGIRLAAQTYSDVWRDAIAAIVLVILARAVAVFVSCAFLSRGSLRISFVHQKVLFWGGLRGALALGLALAIPLDFPQHDAIVAVSFAVVAFSVLVQGITVRPLIRAADNTH